MATLAFCFTAYNPAAVAQCDARVTRTKLLKLAPRGSSFGEVVTSLKRHGIVPRFAHNAGYIDEATQKTIGIKSINALVEECQQSALAITSLTAYWGFDSEGRLLDVQVSKTVDAP